MKGCVYDPFCSNILPCLRTFYFNLISLFSLFITFGEVLDLVRIDLIFLVICQLLMIWIELRCHDCLLKKWCFQFQYHFTFRLHNEGITEAGQLVYQSQVITDW